ncbi:aminodeoxychorismate synthase, component I, partial [Stenotrophomonas maltophilia]
MTHAPLIHPLPHPIDLLALQQHDPARFPLLMESTASGTAQGRWSLLLAAQGESLRLDADGQVRDLQGAVQPGTFLQALDRAWQHERLPHDGSHSLPFRGGWALMLDYEVASQIEPVLPA